MDPASIAFAALAEEFRRQGRHEEAIETCRAGLQRHPSYLSARVTLGRALIETGDYNGAREELETVLRSAPENLAAIRGLALIHERLGHSAKMDPHLAEMMRAEAVRVAHLPPPPEPAAVPAQQPDAPGPLAASQAALESPAQPAPAPAAVAPAEAPVPVADRTEPPDVVADQRPLEPEPPIEIAVAPEPEAVAAISVSFAAAEPEQAPQPWPITLQSDAPPALHAPEPVEDVPDPATVAAIARLTRFLAAIDAARHA
jgi:tetratricopeptide (TPR) repeat protein